MAKDVSDPGGRSRQTETTVSETGPVDLRAAIDALDRIAAVWVEPGSPPVIATGRAATVTGSGSSRFRTVKREAEAVFASIDHQGIPRPARPRLFGGFSFFDEDRLAPPWTDFEPAGFVLPAVQVTLAPDSTWVTGIGERARDQVARVISTLEALGTDPTKQADEREAEMQSPTSSEAGSTGLRSERSDWTDRVGAVRDAIRESDLQKVVLSAAYELEVGQDFDLGSVLAALESRYPECYRFGFTGPKADLDRQEPPVFFGASPERLVEKTGQRLETEALAGTVERGAEPPVDDQQVERLLGDGILAQEHELVADQIRAQLDGLGADVSVAERSVRTLANVHHLRTPIDATLPSGVHVLDVVASLHPTPALGGHPTEKARRTIAEHETTVRGWYGAPVGWFDADGDGSFAVGIRSALVNEGQATLFAGNGIVAGSDPAAEWDELAAKFEPIREVLE